MDLVLALEDAGATTTCHRGVRLFESTSFPVLTSFIADRGQLSHREDLPLPTEPPYTAFVGNLAFDLTEIDLEEFFAGHQVRSRLCVYTV